MILKTTKAAKMAAFDIKTCGQSALAGFELALRFVDHIHATFTAHDPAVAMPVLERTERIANLHGLSPVLARTGAGLRWFRCTGI